MYAPWQAGLEAFTTAVREVLDGVTKGNGIEWEDNFPVDIDLN